jgi:pimeloyl-ACP methyl ester carboxylesterase
MTNQSVAFIAQRASTAVASYGSFDTDAGLQTRLVDPRNQVLFTNQQANAFATQYTFIHQQPNVPFNGFSATLFYDKVNQTHVLAVRGTETTSLGQGWLDLFVQDGLSIGGNGFASTQAVEMARYYKRLTTVGGQAVQYSDQEKWQLFAIANSVLVPLTRTVPVLSAALLVAFEVFKVSLAADVGIANPQNASQPLLAPGEKIDVTGHSLGGHLAMLFERLFPNNVAQVTALNAPGLFERGDQSLTAFGFPAPTAANGRQDHILRIEADGDPVSEIGTVWPGLRQRVAQEDSPLVADSLSNHSGANANDALAVMSLMTRLDSRLANDLGVASALLRGTSNKPEPTLENAVDSLRRTLLGPGVGGTAISFGGKDPNRQVLFTSMANLQASAPFTALAGKVQINLSSANLHQQARSAFSTFTSLYSLSPLVVSAAAGQSQSTVDTAISAAWGATFTAWQADNNLSVADKASGKATYTDTWLADRATLLGAIVQKANRNELDSDIATRFGNLGSSIWTDVASGRVLVNGTAFANQRAQVYFGDGTANTFAGFDKADHLYGAAESDTLSCLAGNDYLEGNADIDTLNGGEGNDTLLGGAGADVYRFDAAFGRDVELDQDNAFVREDRVQAKMLRVSPDAVVDEKRGDVRCAAGIGARCH